MTAMAIELSGMRFAWPGERPLLSVDRLTVAAGERIFLFGPSGSGKSTLLGLLAGIHRPVAGTISVLGRDLTRLSRSRRDRLRGAEMGFVFQQFNLVAYLSVIDNVLLPLAFSAARRRRAGGREAGRQEAQQLLLRLGLHDPLPQRRATALSVGQQQRVAVARALLGAPPLIICDEPTSALDQDARDSFLDVLTAECTRAASTLVFVSHDRSLSTHFDREIDITSLQAQAPC